MRFSLRAACALLLAFFATVAFAQQAPVSERDKIGYMIGMDVARSVAPAVPDLDMASFQKAIENAIAGKPPLLDEAAAKQTSQALMASINARKGGGQAAASLDRAKVGLLVGTDVGRSLLRYEDEFDLPMFLAGFRAAALPGGKPLLTDAETNTLRSAFSQRLQAKFQAAAATLAADNTKAGDAFLAKNKAVKGVFNTPSGLQYMILRQGSGPRPKPGQRVKVNYQGSLLDGKVFDSSYERGQPAEFSLDQVIPGWTEGVGMMPVGGKYRFWIPGKLGYGEKGTPDGAIGPNATLVFDVELLDVQ